MKKVLFALLMLVASGVLNAQEITMNMFNIYFGHPKKAVIVNGTNSTTVMFDENGRVFSKQVGSMRYEYVWDDENDEVEVTLMNGDLKLNSSYIYINSFTPNSYDYEFDGVHFVVDLKDNGAIRKITMTNPQMTMTQEYFYDNEDDYIPQKIVSSNGMMVQTTFIGTVELDEVGNMTKCTGASNGMILESTNEIEYY